MPNSEMYEVNHIEKLKQKQQTMKDKLEQIEKKADEMRQDLIKFNRLFHELKMCYTGEKTTKTERLLGKLELL